MLTFPTLCYQETVLRCPYGDGLLTVPFWRGGLAYWNGYEAPRAPFGCFTVAFVERRGPGVVRCFYLSALGKELDGFKNPNDASDNIVLPASVIPTVPAMTRATKFGFDKTRFCGQLRARLEGLHNFHRERAIRSATAHGFRMPSGLEPTFWNVADLPI